MRGGRRGPPRAMAESEEQLWEELSKAGGAGGSAMRELRGVRRDERCLLNRLRSIREDAEFAGEFARALGLPAFANLRCGLWYSRPGESAGTCYFKSTDGHAGQWAFSSSRLNMHLVRGVCERDRGVLLLDSTRKGKRFPDSMSKTVPVWACVVNRAVARLAAEGGAAAAAAAADAWDTDLHLPPFVPASERAQIEALLPSWVDALLALPGAGGLEGLRLEKPLRPLWFSRGSRLPEAHGGYADAPFYPVACLSVSRPEDEARGARAGWCYVQGAGDDEEAWARGLRPALFWANVGRLAGDGVSMDASERAADEIVAAAADEGRRAAAGGAPLTARGAVAVRDTGVWVCEEEGVSAATPPPPDGSTLWDRFGAVAVAAAAPSAVAAAAETSARWRAFVAGTGHKDDKVSLELCAGPLSDYCVAHLEAGRNVLVVAPALAVAAAAAACVLVARDERRPTKQSIRDRLAEVQACCPQGAYVARNLAKQINRHFLSLSSAKAGV